MGQRRAFKGGEDLIMFEDKGKGSTSDRKSDKEEVTGEQILRKGKKAGHHVHIFMTWLSIRYSVF